MFERYTEPARRLLFFSRYEASVHGSLFIETEHLLLGLMRELKGPLAHLLSQLPLNQLRADIASRIPVRPQVPTSVELPFSAAAKRVLQFAAEESDQLRHGHIGTEHLLLALLRDEGTVAGSILVAHGLRLPDLRNQIAELPHDSHAGEPRQEASMPAPMSSLVRPPGVRLDAIDGAKQIAVLIDVIDHLGRRDNLSADARELIARIRGDLNALKPHVM